MHNEFSHYARWKRRFLTQWNPGPLRNWETKQMVGTNTLENLETTQKAKDLFKELESFKLWCLYYMNKYECQSPNHYIACTRSKASLLVCKFPVTWLKNGIQILRLYYCILYGWPLDEGPCLFFVLVIRQFNWVSVFSSFLRGF